MAKTKEAWGSRIGLILAMAGNAVGLGNFLRFPVQAVQNGGGTFIIPYLVCFVLMGIPLLWIEWTLGRLGGTHGHHTSPLAFDTIGKKWYWKYLGVFGIFSTTAVASYYCYIESWTLSYIFHSIKGSFTNLDAEGVGLFFNNYVDLGTSTLGIPFEPIVFFIICLLLNTYILSKGLSGGVELTAKIAMPLLILFGIILAIKGLTIKAGVDEASFDAALGLNFLWTPQFDSLGNPKVWLAAAGQIFFTLSVGMGSIQCYASYIKEKDDIALNAMGSGWLNEFVEVVLGGAILIPISVGYLGIDKVVELTKSGGFGLGFKVFPYLFQQWGDIMAMIAGTLWFGLLFFAGITSSLAMGTPWMSFLADEFNISRKWGAWSFGAIVLILGLPSVLFFTQGVLDEFDFWAGTFSLFVFAMCETILFAWVLGTNNGFNELHKGADIKVPNIFKFIIHYITPTMLITIFTFNLIMPKDGDIVLALSNLFSEGWILDDGSIIKYILNSAIHKKIALSDDPLEIEKLNTKLNYINFARILLLATFSTICFLVWKSIQNKNKSNDE